MRFLRPARQAEACRLPAILIPSAIALWPSTPSAAELAGSGVADQSRPFSEQDEGACRVEATLPRFVRSGIQATY
jgi:hypothetical protein